MEYFRATREAFDTPPNLLDSGTAETAETKRFPSDDNYWESGMAVAEQRDREIRALVVSLEAFLAASLLDHARTVAKDLRELVDRRPRKEHDVSDWRTAKAK